MNISVIMPIYNAADFVVEAIDSVLKQRFNGKFELILIDDNSTDSSLVLISKFNTLGNVKILTNELNIGYPKSMNKALKLAIGDFIVRMDADDIMHPDLLQLLFNQINENEAICFASCRRFFLTYSGKPYHFVFSLKDQYKIEVIADLRNKTRLFNDVGTIYRLRDAREIGFYNTYQRSGMDVDFWLRLYEYSKKPSLTINKPLIGKRHLPNSIIFKKNTSLYNEIPRLLSDYRLKNNLSPNYIPDVDWIFDTKCHLENTNVENNNFSLIAHLMFINLKFRDLKGFNYFLLLGVRRGCFQFLRVLISEIRKNHSNYILGFPKVESFES